MGVDILACSLVVEQWGVLHGKVFQVVEHILIGRAALKYSICKVRRQRYGAGILIALYRELDEVGLAVAVSGVVLGIRNTQYAVELIQGRAVCRKTDIALEYSYRVTTIYIHGVEVGMGYRNHGIVYRLTLFRKLQYSLRLHLE